MTALLFLFRFERRLGRCHAPTSLSKAVPETFDEVSALKRTAHSSVDARSSGHSWLSAVKEVASRVTASPRLPCSRRFDTTHPPFPSSALPKICELLLSLCWRTRSICIKILPFLSMN